VIFVLKIKDIFERKIQPKSAERDNFIYIRYRLLSCIGEEEL